MFQEPHDKDLISRLTGSDDAGFRSGMSECLVAWLLAGPLRRQVKPRPEGRQDKELELLIEDPEGDIHVEVKAPFREASGDVWMGHDSDLLASCLDHANEQFSRDTRNVLFLVPELRLPVFTFRVQLVTAFFGEEKIAIPIDTRTGGPAGPTEVKFFPDGKFLNPRLPSGRFLKLDRKPAFTRVGAVVSVEEQYHEGMGLIFHRMLVVHNPHAEKPVPAQIWGDCPQFLLQGDALAWTDGHPLSR